MMVNSEWKFSLYDVFLYIYKIERIYSTVFNDTFSYTSIYWTLSILFNGH